MLSLPLHYPLHPHPTADSYSHFQASPARSMDSTATDFRAFYPYTPNEVKHRKRTTNAQLKTLESVFKRDTKPNGPLRVELATKLGMTARGVQVWFQNRRAKEKLKAAKLKKIEAAQQDLPEPQSDEEKPASASLTARQNLPSSDTTGVQSHTALSASSPHISGIHEREPSQPWESPKEPTHSLASNPNLHTQRRGSLPVNSLPEYDSLNGPADAFDPLARRFSVDANLQRLASNPYAHLARAKNDAVFGPRAVPVRQPIGRGQQIHKSPASLLYPLDIRRASLGGFRTPLQKNPSPLSHYVAPRQSLPDTQLYAINSRTLSLPLPGPLPSPNFSFGAANRTSIVSSSSAGSERNSPDSPHTGSYRETEDDEENSLASTPYFPISRFSSIASIATTASSVDSSYFPEGMQCYTDNQYNLDIRRDSTTSGSFSALMSNLNVNGIHDSMTNPQEPDASELQKGMETAGVVRTSTEDFYAPQEGPYRTSALQESMGERRSLNNSASALPISRSSELAFALHSHQANNTGREPRPPINRPPIPTIIEMDGNQSTDPYSYPQGMGERLTSDTHRAYESKSNFDFSHDRSASCFPENYSVAGTGSDYHSMSQAFIAPNLQYQSDIGPLEQVPPSAYTAYP